MYIVTDRLVLREFVIDDWPAVLAYQRDPRYLRFSPWTNRTEAALAVVNFGFQMLKLHRISAWCIAANTASSRVLERVGLRLEGGSCEKMSTSRGVGGIHCSTAYLRASGGLCPQSASARFAALTKIRSPLWVPAQVTRLATLSPSTSMSWTEKLRSGKTVRQ